MPAESVADLLSGAVTVSMRDSAGELSRAQDTRGIVHLNVRLALGDGGVPLWVESSLYFEQKRHHKDARETPNG